MVPTMPDGQALLLFFAAVIVLILALMYNVRSYQPPVIAHAAEIPHEGTRAQEVHADASDDLTLIEGIGPKIASMLQANGIDSFARLAEADTDRLKELLKGGGLHMADPASWGEQARLAAAGDWNAFTALTDQLKAGRAR